MFVRQKEAKYSQISIYQFFGRQQENHHAIACSKIFRKEVVFTKYYKNTLIKVFLHAEFISALETEPKPTVFEKYAKNRKKIYYHYFLFFVIFSISFKSQKIENNDNKYIFSIFCIFLKNRRLSLRFQARNEFCIQKYPSKGIFIGFRENRLFSENFRTGYSMAIFMVTAKKLIYTNLAIFGFFLSNKHDSFGFRKFCLKLIEKITKNRK